MREGRERGGERGRDNGVREGRERGGERMERGMGCEGE